MVDNETKRLSRLTAILTQLQTKRCMTATTLAVKFKRLFLKNGMKSRSYSTNGGRKFPQNGIKKSIPPLGNMKMLTLILFYISLIMKFIIADKAQFISEHWASNRPPFGIGLDRFFLSIGGLYWGGLKFANAWLSMR